MIVMSRPIARSQSNKIAMPIPASPLIIEPTPGIKKLTIRLTAGLFGATA